MATITIFRNLFSDKKETFQAEEGSRISDVVDFDQERSHVFINGYIKNASYVLNKEDLCLIREYPGDPFTAGMAVAIISFTALYQMGIIKPAADYLIHEGRNRLSSFLNPSSSLDPSDLQNAEQLKKIPQLRGAKNQSWAGKPVPLVLGEHLLTPGYCGLPYTQIDPVNDPDGENQFVVMLFMLGYRPVVPANIKIGEALLATNSGLTTSGLITIDGIYTTEEYGTKIEIQDSDEVILYPQKVVEEQLSIELLYPEGSVPRKAIRFSATNAMKIEVEIFFSNGLYKLNDDRSKGDATVSLRAQWRPLNGDESDWVDFPYFQNASSTGSGVSTFTRHESKQMRFIASKTLSFAEAQSIPSGIVEVRVYRNNVNSTDAAVSDVVYWSAIRTWCYNKEESTSILIPQIPVTQKLRYKTVRLGLKIFAKDDLQGVLDSINMVVKSICRPWNGTLWESKSYARLHKTISNNPAAVALTVLQGNNLGKNAYSDSELDLAEFGRFYEFCEDEGYTCNGVVTTDMSLDSLLASILYTGRAQKIMRDGLYSIFVDKPQENPITILNNQNVISASNTKEFETIPDGLRVSFIDETDNYQLNEIYVMADGKNFTDPDVEFLDIELPFVTNRDHIWKLGRYILASMILRPEVWTRKVSIEGANIPIGSLITLQDDTIAVGLNSGGEIKQLIQSGSSIIGIITDSYFDIVAGSAYGIKVLQANGVDEPTIRTIPIQNTPGYVNELYFDVPISISETILPSVGDFVAFGIREKITADAIVIGTLPSETGQYELTLIPYDPAIYTADSGTIPAFDSKVTKPTPVPGITPIPAQPLTLDKVAEIINPIITGETPLVPDDITSVSALAKQDYIDITWNWSGSSLGNAIKRFIIEISKDGGTNWSTFYSSSTRYVYYFDRSIEGYPEKNSGSFRLDLWRVRIKAENIYNQISLGYGPSASGQSLNVSAYKTWIPVKPVIKKLVAEESGIEYEVSIDTDLFYGSNLTYDISLNGTTRISGASALTGKIPFDRAVDGYPETTASRTLNGITAGTALDDFSVIVTCKTSEYSSGRASDAESPSVSGYKTWIPHLPSIAVAAAGRNITLRFTPGNDCYGSIKYRFQVQKSTDGTDYYAVGDNAQAWADETAYQTGTEEGYSETPLESYVQVVPLTNQSADLPEDTTYNYRAAAVQSVLEASGGVYITAYTDIATAIARATATKDIVAGAVKTEQLGSGAVTNDKILARTIRAENISVTARSKINTFNDPDDGLTGWNTGGVIEPVDNSRALKLTAPSNTAFQTAAFSVEPDEIIAFSFGLQCPNYTTNSGLFIGLTTAQTFKRYTWSFTAKKWVYSSQGTNCYFISDYKATTRKNFKTYILGSSVDITDIPAPSYTDETYAILCLQLMPGDRTASIRSGYNAVTTGTYWYIFNPLVVTVGASKIVAEQIQVTSLAAVNSRLGQVQGDDAANYKLVLGQGFTDPEGTFLLGSVNDDAYFRRTKVGETWTLAIKTSSFIVTSVSSTVIGTFYVKATAAGGAVFTVTPTVNISTALPLWVDGRITVTSRTGNDYNQLAIEVRGNGTDNTVYPGIGFHQPGKYAGALLLSAAGSFKFYNQALGSYAGLSVGNLTATGDITVTGNISAAGSTIRRSFTLDLSALSTNIFYPVTFGTSRQLLDCEILSPSVSGSLPYNQNAMHFQLRALGWSDTPKQLEVLSGQYDSSEVTIGAIMCGNQGGDRAVYLRGGFVYSVLSNHTPTLRTTTYTLGNEQYVPGTAYTGGSNVNVSTLWTASEALGTSVKTIYGGLNVSGLIQSRHLIQVNNASGNLQLGALNAGYCHFVTDRPSFYFDHALTVNGDISRYDYASASRQVGTLHGYNMQRHTHSSGYLIGSYNSAGPNDARTNPIYTIGANYMPTDTSLGAMYGIGYSHSNFWGTGKSSGWGLYLAENGVVKATISSGGIWTAGGVYAQLPSSFASNVTMSGLLVLYDTTLEGPTVMRDTVKISGLLTVDNDMQVSGNIVKTYQDVRRNLDKLTLTTPARAAACKYTVTDGSIWRIGCYAGRLIQVTAAGVHTVISTPFNSSESITAVMYDPVSDLWVIGSSSGRIAYAVGTGAFTLATTPAGMSNTTVHTIYTEGTTGKIIACITGIYTTQPVFQATYSAQSLGAFSAKMTLNASYQVLGVGIRPTYMPAYPVQYERILLRHVNGTSYYIYEPYSGGQPTLITGAGSMLSDIDCSTAYTVISGYGAAYKLSLSGYSATAITMPATAIQYTGVIYLARNDQWLITAGKRIFKTAYNCGSTPTFYEANPAEDTITRICGQPKTHEVRAPREILVCGATFAYRYGDADISAITRPKVLRYFAVGTSLQTVYNDIYAFTRTYIAVPAYGTYQVPGSAPQEINNILESGDSGSRAIAFRYNTTSVYTLSASNLSGTLAGTLDIELTIL